MKKLFFLCLIPFLILIFFVCFSLPTAPVLAVVSLDVKSLPSFPFIMSDWDNKDWASLKPEWGPVGGWWDDGPPKDPSKTCFPWGDTWFGQIERYLAKSQNYQVTLDSGQKIPKPVGFAVGFPNLTTSQLPQIENFVKQAAEKYDNHPQLSFLVVCSCDNYGEFSSTPQCNAAGIVNDVIPLFRKYFKKLTIFVQCTTWNCGDFAATFTDDNWPTTGEGTIKNFGVKCNGWTPERADGYVWKNDKLVGGCFGFAQLYHGKIPVGFEPAGGTSLCEVYWLIMEGLSLHADFFDIQHPFFPTMISFEKNFNFPLLRFIRDHLQKTPQNAPDVWTILKQTTINKVCWQDICQSYQCAPCEYGEAPDPNCKEEGKRCSTPQLCYTASVTKEKICSGPRKGNLNYWLYPREDLPQGKPVTLYASYNPTSPCSWRINDLPSPAAEHPYSRYSVKRTDQHSGNPFIYFDIDDRFITSKQNLHTWNISIVYVDKGNDNLSLEYKDKNGQLKEEIFTKQNTNQWTEQNWTISDANFNNPFYGGADFRLNSKNDGDEVIHRVIIKPSDSCDNANLDGDPQNLVDEKDLSLYLVGRDGGVSLETLLSCWKTR